MRKTDFLNDSRNMVRAAIVALGALFVSQHAAAIIIEEFRLRGPNGASDEFIKLYNEAGTAHTVTSSDASSGYSIAASDGVLRCTIPNGTVIPSHGHFLCTNSGGYSLGGLATGDATYAIDIPDNAGIALFSTSNTANYAVGTRLDAVGSASEANTLYKRGTGYPTLTPFSIDYSFMRDLCGKQGSTTLAGSCTAAGLPIDTGNNATDFYFTDTNGTSAGAGQRLAAPGPANLASPIFSTPAINGAVLDTCADVHAAPNVVRDNTSDPGNNSTFGTYDVRRTFTNNTGAPLTSLRFRVIDLSTFPAPSGTADLRPRTSANLAVTVDGAPCGSGSTNPTVQGTTLEQPPSQPNGGGTNSTYKVASVTPGTPLADGASIDVRFLLGVQQNGKGRLGLIAESLPAGGNIFEICFGCGPTVVSSVRVNANPTNAATAQYTVTFSESVTGVDASDFSLTTTGTVAGASVTGVSGSGATYTVTVNTGTGDGTIRLDVTDDDTILNAALEQLGGVGAGNGNFTTGQVYTIDKTAPTVTINQAAGQVDPTGTSPINFTVVFLESVTGFTNGSVVLSGTAGATTAVVTGSGTTYNVAVSGMTSNGTVIANVSSSAATDAASNPSAASTSTDNSVTYSGVPPTVVSVVRTGASPTNAASAQFTVTFSQSVTGVDSADFAVTPSGVVGAAVTGVSGSGTTYTVTVNTGTGDGNIRLDIIDNDSITNGSTPLGGAGAGNGNFTAGQVYAIDKTAPTVAINQAAGQVDPASASPINFTVVFSEPVTSLTSGGVILGGTAGATTTVVSGSGTTFNVAVSGMTGPGTVTASIAGAAVTDIAGNANGVSSSTDNSVVFSGVPASIPTLGNWAMILLSLLLVAMAYRRKRS